MGLESHETQNPPSPELLPQKPYTIPKLIFFFLFLDGGDVNLFWSVHVGCYISQSDVAKEHGCNDFNSETSKICINCFIDKNLFWTASYKRKSQYTKDERSWKLLRWYLFQIHRASILSIHGFSLVLYKQHGPPSWSPLWKFDKNFKNFLNTLLAVEQAHLTGLPTIIVWKMSFWCDFIKNMVNPVRGRNPGTSNAFKISSF